MKNRQIISIIGAIEILIGGITLLVTLATSLLGVSHKSINVLVFVLLTSILSTLIGIGLLKSNRLAYQALLYFSSVIILSKILIFFGIMELNGAMETQIPSSFKNIISIIYHSAVIYFLTHHSIREVFHHTSVQTS